MKEDFYKLEKLDFWKKGRKLRQAISSLVKTFPSSEKYKLIDQMIRASRSVTANVAEGYGRFHYQENIQFCRQARGSLFELLDHLSVALDEDYISDDKYNDYSSRTSEVIKVLNGYIKYLTEAWGHSVADLLKELGKKQDIPDELFKGALELDKAYIPTRYPNVHPSGSPRSLYIKEEARRLTLYAEKIIKFCSDLLSKI